MNEGSESIFIGLANILAAWWIPIQILVAIIGLFMAGGALLKLGGELNKGGGNLSSGGNLIRVLLVAGVLVNIMTAIDMMSYSMFMSAPDNRTGLTFNGSAGDSASTSMLRFVVFAVQFIGFIGFVSGWVALSKSPSERQGGLAKPIMHIIGGTFALNYSTAIGYLANDLGGAFGTMATRLFGTT